jgi:hypothetical protein
VRTIDEEPRGSPSVESSSDEVDKYYRLECLKLAVATPTIIGQNIELARSYYAFITGEP